jgi:hypothetical protein
MLTCQRSTANTATVACLLLRPAAPLACRDDSARASVPDAAPRQGSCCADLCLSRVISVMAKKVSLLITDDLDGSPGAEALSFGLDGVSYEIDLAPPNKARLADAVAPYVAAGRRIGRRDRPAGRPVAARVDRAAVRAWARDAGLAVSARGPHQRRSHEPVRGRSLTCRPRALAISPKSVQFTERDASGALNATDRIGVNELAWMMSLAAV